MNRLLIAALSLTMLSGCYWDGAGLGSSDGRFEYVSTVHTPYTVKLEDTSTGETLWTYEVPVGNTLSLRFLQGHDAEAQGKDTMKWEVFPTKRVGEGLTNSMSCPPASSRIVKVYIREQPEAYPTDTAVVRPSVSAAASNPAPAPKPVEAPAAQEPVAESPKPTQSDSGIVTPDPNQPAPSETAPLEPVSPDEPK
jgi:hypothetical protein